MSLADDYERQYAWRPWQPILATLPPLAGTRVLDLGCGPGQLSAELASRGAQVISIDGNEELVREARARHPELDVLLADIRQLPELGPADGIWCSFTVAYLPDLVNQLVAWAAQLRPGGWIALTEVDDLFGHEPVSAETRDLLEGYASEALRARRYDFHMGHKLPEHLRFAGFALTQQLTLVDRELAFDGPADPEVLTAWNARFARMALLKDFCGERFEAVRHDLLRCLARPDHRARARVVYCLGRKD